MTGPAWVVAVLLVVAAFLGALAGAAVIARRDRERHRRTRRDPLTGLGNRTELERATTVVLSRIAGEDGSRGLVLLLVDLDGFKDVNTILGHAAGDAVLVQVASQLKSAAGPGALVTRLGGDEFAVLMDGRHTAAEAVLQAKKLLVGLGVGDFNAQGVSLDLRATIGIAIAPQHGRTLADLLMHADAAVHEAKRSRDGVRVYEPELDPRRTDSLGSLSLLRGAMDTGQLHLRYQPVVSASTGRLHGFEALVRWEHPVMGLVLPAEFIPLVERTSLIHPLTRWTLLTAVRQAATWRAQGLDITIAVNISAVTLDRGLIGMVQEALALSRWPADRLILEVTESAITLNPDAARQVVSDLRAIGVAVSVDDFGAGFTSLAVLGGLKVHQLKIDRQFIERLGEPEHDAIVSSIIELGHRLGLVVVAEGVETDGSAQMLRGLGCDELQGYHYARPIPAGDVVSWVGTLPRPHLPAESPVAPVSPVPAAVLPRQA